jgi:hypothetical protein
MNKKTVFIHIGLPKTGTTSIQTFLRRNAEALAARGYCYPGTEFGESANHDVFLNAITGGKFVDARGLDLEAQRKIVGAQMEEFRAAPSCHSIVFSHESISIAAQRLDLEYLREICAGMKICFIVYSRFSDEWLETLYQQYLWNMARREHHFRRPFQRVEDFSHLLGLASRSIRAISGRLEKIQQADIVIRSFEESRKDGNLLPGFLEILGGDLRAAFPDAKNERSLNTGHVSAHSMLLYHLYRGGVTFPVARDLAVVLNKRKNRKKREGVETRHFRFLPEAVILHARKQYADDVAQFPQLPAQPPLELRAAEYFMPREDVLELLNLVRGEIPDETYNAAAQAYAL